MSMKLSKKGEAPKPDDAEAIAAVPFFPWDHAMKALGTGDYDVVGNPRDGRGPDQPGAQSPAPGTKPLDGSDEKAAEGDTLTNLTKVSAIAKVDTGLPASPAPPKNDAPPPPKLAPAPAAK